MFSVDKETRHLLEMDYRLLIKSFTDVIYINYPYITRAVIHLHLTGKLLITQK